MKIVWTKKAQKRLGEISGYIQLEFGDYAKQAFTTKTKDFTRLLSEFPEIGTVDIMGKYLRGFQLTKQTRVFYRLKEDRIIILTFFDTRRDPKKRPS